MLAESNEGVHGRQDPVDDSAAQQQAPAASAAAPKPPQGVDRFQVRTYIPPEPVVQFAQREPPTPKERARSRRRRNRRRRLRRITRFFMPGR